MVARTLSPSALNPLLQKTGKKTVLRPKYQKLLAEYLGTPFEHYVVGVSPEEAAAELGMSRQAVHQAVARNSLDAWYVQGKSSGDVLLRVVGIHVTLESIKRYKKSGLRRA